MFANGNNQALAAADVCDLETMGRVSGLAQVVELWFAASATGDRVYILSGGRDAAAWVRNIAVNPAVRLRIAGRWFLGAARAIEGEADDPLARRLLAAKYQAWREGRPLTAWARDSLPVAIDLTGEDRAG